jgi:hypothetical protein
MTVVAVGGRAGSLGELLGVLGRLRHQAAFKTGLEEDQAEQGFLRCYKSVHAEAEKVGRPTATTDFTPTTEQTHESSSKSWPDTSSSVLPSGRRGSEVSNPCAYLTDKLSVRSW